MTFHARLAGVVLTTLSIVGAHDGARAYGSKDGLLCRTYPLLQTSTLSGGSVKAVTQTCKPFNKSTSELTCTIKLALNPAGSMMQDMVFSYNSVAHA